MDVLERHLSVFITTGGVDWKLYVQGFTWAVTLFESYLLQVSLGHWIKTPKLTGFISLRQFPLYSKTAPPSVLSAHFNQDTFQKSQNYGKDKAKFSLFSGLFKQCIDSALLHYGIYAWSWDVAGQGLARFGYGSEYEVCFTLRSFTST